jgi:hypothetical protein
MARNKSAEEPEPAVSRPIADRIAAFAMLDGMNQAASQAQKCLRLALVGFTNIEIAEMLQTTPAVVASSVYQERKKKSTDPAQRSAKKVNDSGVV